MNNIIGILAILLSPIIAVLISMYIQSRREKRQQQMFVFATLMATRHQYLYSAITDETVRALNMIDTVFHNEVRVRELWREYFDMLANAGLNNPVGWEQRQKKNLELLQEMAKALGYGKELSQTDITRVYSPIVLGEQARRNIEIQGELLRVLKESTGFQLISKQP